MNFEQKIANELNQLTTDFEDKKYLIAVSGGADSMCLLNAMHELRLCIEVAHFNFQLRGEESDGDQLLVEQWCKSSGIKFHCSTANTIEYAKKNQLSTQESARELRYNWFYELIQEHQLDWIVTAHHANDTIETFFINLLRGAGIKGLSGIPKINQNILRPMLSVTRAEIDQYITQQNILYRKDSSNDSLKYKRNHIRHLLLTTLNNIDAQSENAILNTIEHLQSTEEYLQQKIEEDKRGCTTQENDSIWIRKEISPFLLFEIIREYGFNYSQVEKINNNAVVGSLFHSNTHQLLVDRSDLIVTPLSKSEQKVYTIEKVANLEAPIKMEMSVLDAPLPFTGKNNQAQLDFELLEFPLTLRKWEEGDWFIPLGMKGKKKLSDFFIDQKFSRLKKENTWLLISGKKIVWIVNHRMDDRYKITDQTKKVLNVVTFCLD